MTETLDDDLLSAANVADPYPALIGLLEQAPVRWSAAHGAWMVLGHAEFMAALRDTRLSSDRVRPVFERQLSAADRELRAPTLNNLQHWMVFNDPPNHTRLRNLVSGAFTPKVINRSAARIEALVGELLDSLAGRDEIDLVHEYAFPLPAIIIAELLGIPSADRDLFKKWSDCIMSLVFGAGGAPGRRERAQQGLLELDAYLRPLIRAARGSDEDNLLSFLATAHEASDSLSEDEIVATCTLLLFAGHETTTNLIGNATRALLRNPEQLEHFRKDEDCTKRAVEELLRFDGPSKVEIRRTAETFQLGEHEFGEGDQVLLVQAAANRDPREFKDPNLLDLERSPNRHVGFGFGLHHCLGSALARLEGQIALRRLVERFPDLELTDTMPTWHPVVVSRGMATFEVRLGTPAPAGQA